MLARMGYKPGSALGRGGEDAANAPCAGNASTSTGPGPGSDFGSGFGSAFGSGSRLTTPVPIALKPDRGGIGLDSARKRALREEGEREGKRVRGEEEGYRERVGREREERRVGGLLRGAMGVGEGLDDEENKGGDEGKGGGKGGGRVNVLWRGLVREREGREREGRVRREVGGMLGELGGVGGAGGGYGEEEGGDGGGMMGTVVEEEVEEGVDEELEAFEALDVRERLARVVRYLRRRWRYCFWCKCRYEDEGMEGCPGEREEDHD